MNKRFLYFSLMIFVTGCSEKIDMKLDDSHIQLSVEGTITTDSLQQAVKLTRSAGYFSNQPAPAVSRAIVTLSDGTATDTLREDLPARPGTYALPQYFRGMIGKTYSMEIKLAEPIGDHTEYSASCRIMQSVTLDSISAIFDPSLGKEGYWQIRIFAQDPGDETNYYLFRYSRNGVLVSDSIEKWSITDDRFFNGSYIDGLTAFYLNYSHSSETLHPGDTILVQMSAITREYYNFILQVQQAGIQIPFFSGPPANVEGNISNGGIGFLSAYSSSRAAHVVSRPPMP